MNSSKKYIELATSAHDGLSEEENQEDNQGHENDCHPLRNSLPSTSSSSSASQLENSNHFSQVLQNNTLVSPSIESTTGDNLTMVIKEYGTVLLFGLILLFILTIASYINTTTVDENQSNLSNFGQIKRIAFGSCTSYDLRDKTIWDDAIIPNQIDAWIWAGDFVYLDDAIVNCNAFQKEYIISDNNMWQTSCNCTPSWLEIPPFSCQAGNIDFAQERWLRSLSDTSYNNFLEYMCPKAMELGIFPPPGYDSKFCDKPILGIYDDHDYGVNNMNRRLPLKAQYKNMYLDAIGEDRNSIRRNNNRGAWYQYTLNDHFPLSGQVDIFMLDERYERDSLPCDTMRDACERLVIPDSTGKYKDMKPWCYDFLFGSTTTTTTSTSSSSSSSGNQTPKGMCCGLDEQIYYGWCLQETSKNSIFYSEACDVTSPTFGHRSLVLDPILHDLRLPDSTDAIDSYQQSPFCDILGKEQRKWLRKSLLSSKAAVKLIISGSVAFHNPLHFKCATDTIPISSNISDFSPIIQTKSTDPVTCRCSGDDWDCYSVAQRELLYLLSQTSGQVVVLTGDFHFSDIKVLKPGSQQLYSNIYQSTNNPRPIYQVMASGMSTSTGVNFSCAGFRLDPLQLRTHPECSFVRGPSYGTVELVYDEQNLNIQSLQLQILGGFTPQDIKINTIVDIETGQII